MVDLIVPYREGELTSIKEVLEDLGFERQGTRDPFPEDRQMWVGSLEHDDDLFKLHVHVVPADSGEPEELRAFRDRLRPEPALLQRYVARKRPIIEGGTTHSVEYAKVKGDFVRRALDGMGSQGRRARAAGGLPVIRAGFKPAPTGPLGDTP